ncbi:MAG: MCP four helix bundle domain-containing protein [Nostoc sp. NOS(2021)]|uniref:ATP-binding protein n=1 Tax=Nostoc sp. NOS(2021) TaxID=2815407 RepID=UPI0034590E2D|nr:MCP four helix bundle domain-containing protein [Nostoc sp. NOS(2021)]
MFSKLNLQIKLFASFGVITAIILIVSIGSYSSISKLSSYINELANNDLPSMDGLWKISEGQVQIESSERLLLNQTLTKQQRQLTLVRINKAWKQIDQGWEQALNTQQALNTPLNNAAEQQLSEQLIENWKVWKQAHQKFMSLERKFYELNISQPELMQGKLGHQGQQNLPQVKRVESALAIYTQLQSNRPTRELLYQKANTSLQSLLKNNQDFAVQIQESGNKAVKQNQFVAMSSILVGLGASLTLAWLLSRAIAQPIQEAHDMLEHRVEERTQELQQVLETLLKTQSQLVQTEKMSSLGQLVAGVAHEINNPVNFIHANVTYLDEYVSGLLALIKIYQQEYPQTSQGIQEVIEEIDLAFLAEDLPKTLASMKVGTKRIRDIVQSLRTFSRMDEAELKSVNIHDGIDSTLMILQHRLNDRPEHSEIHLVKHYGDLPLVECYAGQLNQVFMNILANAIDALEEYNCDRSKISISTDINTQNQVKIVIADNGSGMSESVRQRVFDPFYTTKPVGKGTGLGLSISYQIITVKHGGTLECYSTLEQGTQFVIQIPVKVT